MTTATPTRQASRAPLGLALLLERGGVTLVAPARALAPGVTLLEFAATVPGSRPGTAAECRTRECGVGSVRLRVEVEALLAWVRGRVSAGLPGWSVEQVEWDMSEETGAVWTLRGRDWAGASAWLRVEATVVLRGGLVELGARRCWWLGPAGTTAERQWRALTRRLCGRGVAVLGGRLVVDVLRAGVGVEFAAAGWRLPGMGGVACRLRVAAGALEWRAGGAVGSSGREDGGWSLGQVVGSGQADGGWSLGQVRSGQEVRGAVDFDPLAEVRGWLRGDRGDRGRAERALARLAAAAPELAGELSRVRVAALRFVDRAACVAALGEWIAAAPGDSEPRWLLVVQQALRGDDDGLHAALAGLAELPAEPAVRTRRVLARAIALQRHEPRAAEARALLEPLVAGLPGCPQELQAAVWRALARARAADAAAPGSAVEAAVAAALGEDGWRRRGETGELRAQVAAALVASGRREADTTRLLRRMLGDERPGRGGRAGAVREDRSEGRAGAVREDRSEGRAGAVREDRSEGRGSARIVADYYAQEGRWTELVALLGRELVALDGVARVQALRRIARIYRHHLHDPASAERALRVALAVPGDDGGDVSGDDGGAVSGDRAVGAVSGDRAEGAVSGDRTVGDVSEDRAEGAVSGDRSEGAVSGDRAEGVVSGDRSEGAVSGDRAEGDVSGDRVEGDVSGDRAVGDVSEDRAGEGASDLARLEVELTEVARAGTMAQLDAVLATAAALHGSAELLRVELQAWVTGRPLQPGSTLGLARLYETSGQRQVARGLLQLAAFMVPQGPIAAELQGLPPLAADVLADDRPSSFESPEALRAALRWMAGETAGIRALGEGPATVQTDVEAEALALAEAEIGSLRAALGLPLPLLLGHAGPDGGVSVRNDRPPAIVVNAAFAGLPPAERRFRLALAAAMIAGGLAIVTDPQGASLPELLAALLDLSDETCPARLPGSQAIVRACLARGFRRERLPAGLREALAREVGRWQESRESLARLAHLLRRDNLRVAARLSGSIDGALRTIGRDARLLGPGALDERGALQVLASEDAQWLLRSLGVCG